MEYREIGYRDWKLMLTEEADRARGEEDGSGQGDEYGGRYNKNRESSEGGSEPAHEGSSRVKTYMNERTGKMLNAR